MRIWSARGIAILGVPLNIVYQDLDMLTVRRLSRQYCIVVSMEWRMPAAVVEKLQMSSANCMDGTGRSWRWGGSQLDRNANMRSAIKRLNRRGDKGSPWRRPTLEEKG